MKDVAASLRQAEVLQLEQLVGIPGKARIMALEANRTAPPPNKCTALPAHIDPPTPESVQGDPLSWAVPLNGRVDSVFGVHSLNTIHPCGDLGSLVSWNDCLIPLKIMRGSACLCTNQDNCLIEDAGQDGLDPLIQQDCPDELNEAAQRQAPCFSVPYEGRVTAVFVQRQPLPAPRGTPWGTPERRG